MSASSETELNNNANTSERPVRISNHVFRGTTQSLCPECLKVVPAKIITRGGRVYFRKSCPDCGSREDFVCSDVEYYDRLDYAVPAKLPNGYGVQPNKGCPYDCGLCTEHEQHTCIALVEVTSSCNLKCPMCFASSGPGGNHQSLESCKRSIDRIVQLEGRAEVVQLSGGEPTIHPNFVEILEYAIEQPIDYVQINSNGLRFAHDPDLVKRIASYSDRLEVFMQFDGLKPDCTTQLRGEDILATKLKAIEALGEQGVHITLAVTLQPDVNDDQYGEILQFAVQRPWITGINFQPATYSGRHVLPEQLERRITFPDVIKGIAEQTAGMFGERDFLPLPCAHPNCHQIGLAYRTDGGVIPLTRFFDAMDHLDLLANGITFTRSMSRDIISQLVARNSCCPDGSCAGSDDAIVPLSGIGTRVEKATDRLARLDSDTQQIAMEFLSRAINDELGAEDLLRVTVTSFLDAYNFDLRRLMKCCTHHVLPSGHVIPFCAYNVLYREGHVPLPTLEQISVNS